MEGAAEIFETFPDRSLPWAVMRHAGARASPYLVFCKIIKLSMDTSTWGHRKLRAIHSIIGAESFSAVCTERLCTRFIGQILRSSFFFPETRRLGHWNALDWTQRVTGGKTKPACPSLQELIIISLHPTSHLAPCRGAANPPPTYQTDIYRATEPIQPWFSYHLSISKAEITFTGAKSQKMCHWKKTNEDWRSF
jgi:hypothetical protein